MKQRNKIAVLLTALLLLSLTGCQLAQPDSPAQERDRLIGVWVTTEYLDLFDMESYLQDHAGQLFNGGEISETDMQPYAGRLYAVRTDKTLYGDSGTETVQEYVFEGMEGIPCFFALVPATETEESYHTMISDEALSGGQAALNETDTGFDIDLEATIYVASRPEQDVGQPAVWYFNPVYQTPDGQVYAKPGNSVQGSLLGGETWTHTLEEEGAVTWGGTAETYRTSVKISVAAMDPPDTIVLLQMDEASQVLDRASYPPEALPEKLTLNAEAAYLIAETHSGDRVTRELLDQEDSSLRTFRCREDGICVENTTELSWEQPEA